MPGQVGLCQSKRSDHMLGKSKFSDIYFNHICRYPEGHKGKCKCRGCEREWKM